MAVQVTQKLAVAPSPTSLPKQVRFTHGLVSNRASETVQVDYFLDGGATAIRFLDSANQPAITVRRTEAVTRTPQVFEDRVPMVGQPAGAFEDVEVRQVVTDQGGLTTTNLVIIVIDK